MTQSAKAQEPSMEEILASIRRIIADDDTGKGAKAPEAPKPVPPPAVSNNQDDIDAMLADLDAAPKVAAMAAVKPPPKPAVPPPDVLDLTEAMAASTPSPGPAPSFRTIVGDTDVVFADPTEQRPEPAARAVEDARRQFTQNTAPDHGLISNNTMSAVDSAFNLLAHTALGNNARTLEDLVKEMLRPMLKGWLDDNLPSLVERIVRAEIERVSRGRP
ncbi:MAG: DUF2497 domain-containing protein [Pseudolabrys sp.]|nr:DUF2497 domain-containing protein [Pseudolabrys sp.]